MANYHGPEKTKKYLEMFTENILLDGRNVLFISPIEADKPKEDLTEVELFDYFE